jgi:hypothetical protein
MRAMRKWAAIVVGVFLLMAPAASAKTFRGIRCRVTKPIQGCQFRVRAPFTIYGHTTRNPRFKHWGPIETFFSFRAGPRRTRLHFSLSYPGPQLSQHYVAASVTRGLGPEVDICGPHRYQPGGWLADWLYALGPGMRNPYNAFSSCTATVAPHRTVEITVIGYRGLVPGGAPTYGDAGVPYKLTVRASSRTAAPRPSSCSRTAYSGHWFCLH